MQGGVTTSTATIKPSNHQKNYARPFDSENREQKITTLKTTQADHDKQRGVKGLDSDAGGGGGGGGVGDRKGSTVLEIGRAFAAANAAAAEETIDEEESEFPDGSASVTSSEDGQKQDPAPAPFRGTFWDEEDGEITFPARRVSYNVHSGQRYIEK